MKILITGASGFIGSFLCEEGIKRGMQTWAGVRKNSSKKWLKDERLNFAVLDLAHTDILRSQLATLKQQMGGWDVIVHAGGATKCLHKEEFNQHNFECTRNLVVILNELNILPKQFLYVSSLSVLGPIREEMKNGDYEEMLSTDEAKPNTAYGESKVKSEKWLQKFYSSISKGTTPALDTDKSESLGDAKPSADKCTPDAEQSPTFTIFRPTGVYGPREKDYFMMAKSIKQHIDFSVGYKRQIITFVYVRDLVSAIFATIGNSNITNGKTYIVSDGCNYESRAFSDLIQKELGVKRVLHIKAPLWLLKIISSVAEFFSKLSKKPSTLNGDKYKIMKQRNWKCDITPLARDLGWHPKWQLERGVKECMEWYKNEGWL